MHIYCRVPTVGCLQWCAESRCSLQECLQQDAYYKVLTAECSLQRQLQQEGCLLQGAYQRALTAKIWSGKRQVKEPNE